MSAKKPSGFNKPVNLSKDLAAVLGPKPRSRSQIAKDIWVYIKKHDLQEPTRRSLINADDKLRVVFGKNQVTMFEMTKLISKHLTAI